MGSNNRKEINLDISCENGNELTAIFDNLDEPVFVLSMEKIVLNFNRPFADYLDKDYADIEGRNIEQLDMFLHKDFDLFINRIADNDRSKCSFETDLLCPNNELLSAALSVRVFDYGSNDALLCTIKNIESNFKLSEKKYFDIIENVNDGIAILKDGYVKFANRKSAEMVGYSKDEIIGEKFSKFVSPNHHEKVITHYYNAVNSPIHIDDRFEIDLLSKNKQTIPIEVNAKTIDFESRKSYLVIFREITERKPLEEHAQQEKNRVENYLDVAGSIIGILDKDQNIVLPNKKACEVLGYSKEEMLGQNWFDIFLPEKVREIARNEFIKMIAGEVEAPEFNENWVVTKSGEERLIYWHDVPLKDEYGNITGSISSGHDITDQKIMQKKVRDSEAKIRTIFNSIDDQIYICDQEMNIIDINDSAITHLGYERDELLRMRHDQLIVPELQAATEECARQLFEKTHLVFETALMGKDGSIYPVEVSARFIDYEGQKAIICVDRDISERKNAENEMKKYAEELRESNELKELFTDIIRHDLLTPASIVKGYSEELLAKKLDADTLFDLRKIYDNNERLINLLESATKLSKLQKMDEIEFEELNIVAIFQMVVECLNPNITDKHQTVNINTAIKCNAMVNHLIEEVFTNLLSNAIKYSPDNSNICIDFIDLNNEWKITVSDEGIGIRDEDKIHIFDRFGRADKAGIKGTGLGLAIVKRIIELHKGKLGVLDNPDGQGSIFWVTVKKASSV